MPKAPTLQPTELSPYPGSGTAGVVGLDPVFHGVAPEWYEWHNNGDYENGQYPHWMNPATPIKTYAQTIMPINHQYFPGVNTLMFGYSGSIPGPTYVGKVREPFCVRYTNGLVGVPGLGNIETSVHLHGSHSPAHSDGHPYFYILPGKSRDYFYPNIGPMKSSKLDSTNPEDFDDTENPSTMWYHDHGMDITGHNVSRGLAGFYLVSDHIEDDLIARNILPEVNGPYDYPIVLVDQKFNADGSHFYDFLDHDGRLGDVFTVNGKAQPYLEVERRKYRFRILNGSNSRVYHLRLASKTCGPDPFLIIGNDSWLLPEARLRDRATIAMSQRVEIIIDFSKWEARDRVYLVNMMTQDTGRGPGFVDETNPVPLLRFMVKDNENPQIPDLSIVEGTPLRENEPIHESEITATRNFDFDRANGVWTINSKFFNPKRADVVPNLGYAERWIFNGGGGWWHPIHIHLEANQYQTVTGMFQSDMDNLGMTDRIGIKSDSVMLHAGSSVEFFMKFRTFTGPFVFHCHNLEHEDMRMMHSFDPRPPGTVSILNGAQEIPSEIWGLPEGYFDDVDNVQAMFSEQNAETTLFQDEGVGFDFTDWEVSGETEPPPL